MACGNRVWGNETVMTYLKTGLFRYWLPPVGRIKWQVHTQACRPLCCSRPSSGSSSTLHKASNAAVPSPLLRPYREHASMRLDEKGAARCLIRIRTASPGATSWG